MKLDLRWPRPSLPDLRKRLALPQRFSFGLARRLLRLEGRQLGRKPSAAVLALALGFLLSVGAFLTVQSLFRAEAQKAFEGPASQVAGAVGQSLDRYLEVVETVGAFFAASKEVDRWEFFEFTRDTLPRFPGVTALSWVPWVADADRAAFEDQARDDGLFGFEFKDAGASDELVPAAGRESYFPVYYVEPFEGNEGQLGLDLAGRPAELEILLEARDSGAITFARLGAEAVVRDGADLVAVLPVYATDKVPETLEERHENLIGFARALISLPKVISTALPGRSGAPGLDIYIYEETAAPGARLVAYHPSPLRGGGSGPLAEPEVRDGLFLASRHEVGGHDWSIVVKPVGGEPQVNVQMAAWGVFGIGLLLTLWLVQYLVSSQVRTRIIERAVQKRTTELRETNQVLQTEVRERKRAERNLRAAKERVEMASRAKSDFLAMMSHELRTPLNAVIGFSEMLCNEILGPLGNKQYREYADDIRSSGQDLLDRINDILELTKIDSDDFKLLEEPLDLIKILQAVEPPVREKASAAELTLKVDIAKDLPQLNADPRSLKQILFNLLSNAVKFTPAGGRIAVSAGLDRRGRMFVRVSDTGVGISREHLAQVLQPFSQADSSLGRKFEGTGLGLALTHRLVELHGAKLDIDSEVGAGTTVTVSFPKSRILREAASEVA